jgi:hypothetical protein
MYHCNPSGQVFSALKTICILPSDVSIITDNQKLVAIGLLTSSIEYDFHNLLIWKKWTLEFSTNEITSYDMLLTWSKTKMVVPCDIALTALDSDLNNNKTASGQPWCLNSDILFPSHFPCFLFFFFYYISMCWNFFFFKFWNKLKFCVEKDSIFSIILSNINANHIW